MTTRSSRDRNLGGGEVAGIPLIAAPRASYAAAFTRAFEKSRLSPLGAPQTPRCPSSFQARTSAAEGGRLRFGSAAERRRRCRDRDQELKRDPLPCLINSAGSSTYPTRKSVRTTRATAPVRSHGTSGATIRCGCPSRCSQVIPSVGLPMLCSPHLDTPGSRCTSTKVSPARRPRS